MDILNDPYVRKSLRDADALNTRYATAMAITSPSVAERISSAWALLDRATIDAESAVSIAFAAKQERLGSRAVFPSFAGLNDRLRQMVSSRKPTNFAIALDHVICLEEAVQCLNRAAVSSPPSDKLPMYDTEQYIDRLFELRVLR